MVIIDITSLIDNFEYQEAIDLINKELHKSNDIELALVKCDILFKQQKFQECIDYSLTLIDYCKSSKQLARIIISVILSSMELGDLSALLDYFDKLDAISDAELSDEILINIELLKGHYYSNRGNLDRSIIHYTRSLELSRKIGDTDLVGSGVNSLAYIYRLKGEIQKSLDLSLKNINFKLSRNNKITNLVNIGVILLTRNEFSKAISNFDEAYRLARLDNNKNAMSMIYFYKIKSLLKNNKIDKAEQLFQQLTVMDFFESSSHKIRCSLANAMILSKSTRLTNKIKAQEILEKLLNNKDLDFEMSIIVIKLLIEILIVELKLYGEEEVLKELHQLIILMNSIANQHGSVLQVIESLLYLSRMNYLNDKLDLSVKIIDEAISISEKYNLVHLTEISRKEKELLMNEITKQKNITIKHSNLIDRMNSIDIDDYLKKITEEIYKN